MNDCSVFYPVDSYMKTDNVTILRYPDSLKGITRTFTWRDGSQKGLQRLRAKFMTFVTVPLVENAPLAKDFAMGVKKLQPIVFSHGQGSDRMLNASMLREFASYGFFVIALNHNDRSCVYTLGEQEKEESDHEDDHQPKIMGDSEGPIPIPKQQNKPKNQKQQKLEEDKSSKECPGRRVVKFYKGTSFNDMSMSKLQLNLREAEIDRLIWQVMDGDNLLDCKLCFSKTIDAGIDREGLILVGHELGGLTALSMAAGDD